MRTSNISDRLHIAYQFAFTKRVFTFGAHDANGLLKAILYGVLLFFAVRISSANAGDPNTARRHPHVLFVAIDDQNDWIEPLNGHPLAKTPNLQRLAARGTVFSNAHCQAPLCNPSRTSLLLGLRPSTTGVYGLAPWFRNVETLASHTSLPQAFRQQGYRTLSTGKIYHGAPATAELRAREFDDWGPQGGIGKQPKRKLIPPTPMGNHPLMDWGVFAHQDSEKGDHQITSWALDRIAQRPKNQPLFLCVGYFLPHVPIYVTQKWWDLYPHDESILPKLQATSRGDTPRFSWYLHWNLPEPRLKWVRDNDQWISLVHSYLAATSFVDSQIGRLLDGLEAEGIADDTIVVVWGDHGWHLGEKGITGKNTLWERSTRVPLIFAGPGISRGSVCREPAELLDIYPTLLDLCGLPVMPTLEGLSLKPQLLDSKAKRGRPAVTTHNQGNHTIRSRDWRYIRYADGTEELYDHRIDPEELHNVALLPESAAVLAEHRRWLPRTDASPAPGSAHRILTYNPELDEATWEGTTILRTDPIPE